MEQTWRWWGPNDLITLADVCQTGATGIVTALHDIPAGEVWSREAIAERKRIIEQDRTLGLRWSVVESVQVHERIKLGEGDLAPLFENFRRTIRNLAANGIEVVCYNFMPALDWARTQLHAPLPGGANALRFNAHEFAAFDCFMLERDGAEADWSADVLARAKAWFDNSTQVMRDELLATIMAGLPGAFDRYDIAGLRALLGRYHGFGRSELRASLARFLKEVVPTAAEHGVRLCIHADDPPRPLLGLPRIAGSEEDIAFILGVADVPENGLTLCTGSLGARPANDLPAITGRFADRIHFVHLRNVRNEPDGSFMEADHLDGDTDMVTIVKMLLEEQKRRKDAGRADWRIPFRSDHGHEMLDDVGKPTHPGYPAIGRMRGLAELRGVMRAVAELNGLPL